MQILGIRVFRSIFLEMTQIVIILLVAALLSTSADGVECADYFFCFVTLFSDVVVYVFGEVRSAGAGSVSPRVRVTSVLPRPSPRPRASLSQRSPLVARRVVSAVAVRCRRLRACSPLARLSTTEPPPFCHSLPPFSAVNLRFGHASFVGKMRALRLPLERV